MARTTTSPELRPTRIRSSRPLGAAYFLRIGAHGRLHGQGGIAGAQGVVLVGNGGTKQGHNAIAQHLVDGTLEAVHGVHHVVQSRVEELLGGFGVEAANQLGRVFEVGKQHRDLLALAFQGVPGRSGSSRPDASG